MKNFYFSQPHNHSTISTLREQYLDGLTQPQELYLEMLVRAGTIWSVQTGKQVVGYLILGTDNTLLEVFLANLPSGSSGQIFSEIIKHFCIKKVLCKSFDSQLLSACADRLCTVTSTGVLFRTYKPSHIAQFNPGVDIRLAEPAEKDMLWELNEGVWEGENEVAEFISSKYVFIYEMDHRLIGFGIFSPVIPGRPDYDIGMLVDRPFRRQGYGTRIIQHLAGHCLTRGWRPICGCDIRNLASWHCLEKAGFRSDHRLLLFEFK